MTMLVATAIEDRDLLREMADDLAAARPGQLRPWWRVERALRNGAAAIDNAPLFTFDSPREVWRRARSEARARARCRHYSQARRAARARSAAVPFVVDSGVPLTAAQRMLLDRIYFGPLPTAEP